MTEQAGSVVKKTEHQLRRAVLADISGIQKLVQTFSGKGLMLPLSVGDIIDRIRDFTVMENSRGRIVACVALHPIWNDLCEVRSLAVEKNLQGRGIGRALIEAAITDARVMGASELFTLTYVPEFFLKMGFHRVERGSLPHKIWQDCIKCPKFPDCGESALKMILAPKNQQPTINN